VLLAFGEQDPIFPPPDGQRQLALFSGSTDATLTMIPNAGHSPQIAHGAPIFRARVAQWLTKHGF